MQNIIQPRATQQAGLFLSSSNTQCLPVISNIQLRTAACQCPFADYISAVLACPQSGSTGGVRALQVVKLSDTVQTLPRQVTCNVHGVAQCFLDVGRAAASQAAGNPVNFCISFFISHFFLPFVPVLV